MFERFKLKLYDMHKTIHKIFRFKENYKYTFNIWQIPIWQIPIYEMHKIQRWVKFMNIYQ